MNTVFFIVIAVAILIMVLQAVRNQKLREKYAAFWLLVGVVILVLAAFPQLLAWASRVLGVQVPANLLFFLSIVLLLAVALHLSLAVSNLEAQTRVLAEEVAMLNAKTKDLEPSAPAEIRENDR